MTHLVTLTNDYSRARAKALVDKAPSGYVAEVREPKRTLAQNDRMWGMIGDICVHMAKQGVRYSPDDWKARIMHACGWECQFLPGILDGKPFPTGFRSSKMTKAQMSAMIDWMQAWGDEQGVRWTWQEDEAA